MSVFTERDEDYVESILLGRRYIAAARKHHLCDTCGSTIERGHPYIRVSWLVDGELYVSKQHADRCAILDELDTLGVDWGN